MDTIIAKNDTIATVYAFSVEWRQETAGGKCNNMTRAYFSFYSSNVVWTSVHRSIAEKPTITFFVTLPKYSGKFSGNPYISSFTIYIFISQNSY